MTLEEAQEYRDLIGQIEQSEPIIPMEFNECKEYNENTEINKAMAKYLRNNHHE